MRTVILLAAMIIGKAIKDAHGVETTADYHSIQAICLFLVITILLDAAEFVAKLRRRN